MDEGCYGNAGIKKINAVKELFDNFASRSMAYDFHHIIGLVNFDSVVKTLHTFTENLEKFKVTNQRQRRVPSGNSCISFLMLLSNQ